MRNLTQEAINLAEEKMVSIFPQLKDKSFRQQMNPFEKMQVIKTLIILGEHFEQQLINSL